MRLCNIVENAKPLNMKKIYKVDLKRIGILGAPCKPFPLNVSAFLFVLSYFGFLLLGYSVFPECFLLVLTFDICFYLLVQ